MRKILRLARSLAANLRRATSRPATDGRIARSSEPRSAYNSSIAGRRWNGLLFQPTPHANAVAWGFGFVPPLADMQSLAVPLGRHCFGQKIRIRIWRCRDLKATDPFRAPGARGDRLLFDRVIVATASVLGEPIAQFCRIDVSEIVQWKRCLHLVELSFPEEPRSPLAVGRSISQGPWTWECGWVHLKGRKPVPLERPWGLAWAAYGNEEQEHRGSRLGEGKIHIAGRAEVHAFQVSLPSVTVRQTSQTVVAPPTEFQVPEPKFSDQSALMRAGMPQLLLPYRHAELLRSQPQAAAHHVQAESRSVEDQGHFPVEYRGWACRYDLVSIHRETGQLSLTLGTERNLDPEEFPAQLPRQHIALYSLYSTKAGVEAIPVWDWQDMVWNGRRTDHLWWLESSRKTLRRTFQRLRRGGAIRLAGYGDSLTSLGGRDAQMVGAANGPFRDNLGYFERYGEDWKAGVELFSTEAGGKRRHHRLGWNWTLKAVLEDSYGVEVEYLNWGIPGTTTGSTHKNLEGCLYPNGSEPGRLERLLASNPDIVTVSFGMNDIGDEVDTYGNMRRICGVIRAGGADVIVIGLCQQNAGFGSRDHALWRLTHDQIAAAAHDNGVAYIPTWEIFGDGNEGATGLSRWSHSAASMTNHPGARELSHIGQYMANIFI